jgi:hypothetical protein
MAFWIIYHRRAKKGHAIDELVLIKLFSSNYASDLMSPEVKISEENESPMLLLVSTTGLNVLPPSLLAL